MPTPSPAISAKASEALRQLGDALRRRRRELKITSTAVAEAAGVSRPTYHRIEKGERSVTAGAYAAVAEALGVELGVSNASAAARVSDRRGWIPARIHLGRYPKLKELAWQVQGTDELTPREALDIYRRNWRHVDLETTSQEERDLIEALQAALGSENAV